MYYTACSLLAILKNSCSKLHCQTGFDFIPLLYEIRCDEVKRYHSVSDAMSLAYACRGKPRAFFSVVEGSDDGKSLVVRFQAPLSSKYGTEKTVMARFWPWLSGKSPQVVPYSFGSGMG